MARLMLRHAPMACAVLDAQDRVVEWTPGGVGAAHLLDADLLGSHLRDLPCWEGRPAVRDFLDGAVARARRGETVRFEGPHTRADGSKGTLQFRLQPLREGAGGVPDGLFLSAQDVSGLARERASERAAHDATVGELHHRVKNVLSLMASIVNLNLRKARDLADAQDRIAQRIGAYARSQDIVFRAGYESADIQALIPQTLAPFPQSRLDLELTSVELDGRTAMILNLCLHELGMNAAKYGAWSESGGSGRVALHTRVGESRTDAGGRRVRALQIEWRESGGPRVAPPPSQGFGGMLVTRIMANQIGGEAELLYPPDGVVWRLRADVPV